MHGKNTVKDSRQDHPDRHLGLSGSPNFRDAGGYVCDQGSMAWGRVFRSGHLASLSPADRERLTSLELAMIFDLRRADERRREPSWLPPGANVVSADITPGSHSSAIYADSTQLGGAQAMFEFMCDINREFVASQTTTYKDVFAQLLSSDANKVLFHCSAGKDRTGFAVAVLQLALGVAVADVEADYLLSRNYYLPDAQIMGIRKKYPVEHLSDADLLPMMQTSLDYLHSALTTMERLYGDHNTYLSDGLGLGEHERQELRRRFVMAG
ncbi:MAG: tyrosine-protein phosphatase [Congregibacter sp.]|nr:tyrosine-protein phosphatase [Congregibacter sp.]